jgi:hypothetical protein
MAECSGLFLSKLSPTGPNAYQKSEPNPDSVGVSLLTKIDFQSRRKWLSVLASS